MKQRPFTKIHYDEMLAEIDIYKKNNKIINNDHISVGYPIEPRIPECDNFALKIINFLIEDDYKVVEFGLMRNGTLPDTDILFTNAPDQSLMISIFPLKQ